MANFDKAGPTPTSETSESDAATAAPGNDALSVDSGVARVLSNARATDELRPECAIAELIRRRPAQINSIMSELHQRLGNSFVQRVLAELRRQPNDRAESQPQNPDTPQAGLRDGEPRSVHEAQSAAEHDASLAASGAGPPSTNPALVGSALPLTNPALVGSALPLTNLALVGGAVAQTGLQLQPSPSPQQTPTSIGAQSIDAKAAFIRRAVTAAETGWSRTVVDTFEQTAPAARVALQRLLDMEKIVGEMPDFEATRLGTLGPLVAGQDALNRKRAGYLRQVIDDFGARAEVFALFALRGVYDDDAYALFAELANRRYLHKLLAMPAVAEQIKARGLKTDGFREPGTGAWGAARGVFGGIGDGIRHNLKDDRPGAYQWQKEQLPPEYEGALSQMELAEFEGNVTGQSVVLGAIDQVTFGVPHGIVDLGRSAVSGIIDISYGDYQAGGEKLAGAAIVVLTHLGVKAWRVARSLKRRSPEQQDSGAKPPDSTPALHGPEGPGQFVIPNFEGPISAEEAKLGALLELNPEAQAAMGRLIARIGRGGVEKVAEFVQSSSQAALFVAEHGEGGVYALLEADGDTHVAQMRLHQRQLASGLSSSLETDMANDSGAHRSRASEVAGGTLHRESLVMPGGGTVEIVARGKAVVPTGKVEAYLRGKTKPFTDEMKAEMRRLQELKQAARKEFDKSPSNQNRLDALKKLQHNFQRSQDMAESLDDIGLVDGPESNAALLGHLLEIGQKITSKNRLDFASTIEGPNGSTKLLTTWKLLPDGRVYLATIKVIPRT